MRSFAFGGLALALTLAAGLGAARAQDNNDGLPNGPLTTGSTGAGTNTNAGGAGDGASSQAAPSTRLTPAVADQLKAKKTIADRVKGVARDAFDPAQSGSFIGGIAVSDLAQAGWAGLNGDATAKDQVGDLGHALTTPEFYAGVGMFNLVYANGDRVASKLGADYIAKAASEESAGLFTRLAGGASGFLKENVVLAAALTIPRMVQMDFGGFNLWQGVKKTGGGLWNTITGVGGDLIHGRWGDIGHDLGSAWSPFGDEFSKLKNFSIHSSFKFDKQHLEDLGITLGSFILAKPLWAGVKMLGKAFLEKFLVRQAAAAGVEAGILAVQPEGPGEVVDAAIEVGLVGWTLWDVAVSAVDLGGLLVTANAIQKPIQNWNDHRQFEDAAAKARDEYLAVTKENGGNPDPKKLNDAMAKLATAMADLRDYHYLPVAIEDAKFVDRLKRDGVSQAEIDALAKQVMNDDGAWLAAPGQSSALASTFAPGTKHDGVTNQGDFDGLAQRHADEEAKLLQDLENTKKVPTGHLDPASKDFEWSQNRDQLYDEEIAILARGGSNLTNPDLQNKVLQDMQIVGGLAEAEQGLVKPVETKTPGINKALSQVGQH